MPGVNGVRAAVLVDVKLSVVLAEATGAAAPRFAVAGVVVCSPPALVKPLAVGVVDAGRSAAVLLNPAELLGVVEADRSGLRLLNPVEPVGVVAGVGVLETRPFGTGAAGGDAVGVVLTMPAAGVAVGVGALAISTVLGRGTGVFPAVDVKPGVTVGVVWAGVGAAEVIAVRGVGVVDSLAGVMPEARTRRGGAAESVVAVLVPVVKALCGVGVVRGGVVAVGGVINTGEGRGVGGGGVRGRGLTGAGRVGAGVGLIVSGTA